MRPIPFRVNPAFVTLGDALELSVAHLRSNLLVWLVPAAVYTLLAGILTWSLTNQLVTWFTSTGGYGPAATEQLADIFVRNLPGLIGYALLLILGGIAVYWIAMAIAIGGLPGRDMTADRAVGAGLRTIVLGVLYGVVALAALFVLVFAGLRLGEAAIWLLLLFIPAVMAGFAFLALRLVFAMYAIFDGVGIVDSVRLSWAISGGAMLRILGWLVALGAISFGLSIAANIAGAPFSMVPAVPVLIGTGLTTAFQFYSAVVLAILYESQRMRHVFATPGSVLPGGPVREPARSIEPGGVPVDPLLPPPPPAW